MHVGVKAGDWIKMNYTVTGSGITYPKWIKVEILGVEGTNVTVRLTMHMPDGTESSENLTLELAETFHYDTGGTLDTLFGFGFVIPANLTVGEGARTYITLLFPKRFFLGYEINGEITRTYAGADRAVVYTAYDYIGGRYGNDPLTCYWDKQTGVIVEASATLDGMTVNAKITETNMWAAAPEEEIPFWMQWWFWAIVAVVIVALAGAVYFLKKRKPPTPTAPTPPTEDTEISIE